MRLTGRTAPPGPSTMNWYGRRCWGEVGNELKAGSGLFSSTVLSTWTPRLPTYPTVSAEFIGNCRWISKLHCMTRGSKLSGFSVLALTACDVLNAPNGLLKVNGFVLFTRTPLLAAFTKAELPDSGGLRFRIVKLLSWCTL